MTAANFDWLQPLDRAPRQILGDRADRFYQLDKGRRAAIHRRHLRSIKLDNRIVNTAAGKCRHQMLDGSDLDPFAIRQHGAERRVDAIGPKRVDLSARVDPAEYDAPARCSRPQRHPDAMSAMKADAVAERRAGQCPLPDNSSVPQP